MEAATRSGCGAAPIIRASLITFAVIVGFPAVGQDAVVEMTDANEFVPDVVTISVGDTVRWDNRSNVRHTVTADPSIAIEEASVELPAGAETFDSGPIDEGASWSYTFTVPGRYLYFCIPHELQGMLGTVIVDPDGTATSEVADVEEKAPSPESSAGTKSTFVFGGHQAPRHKEVREAEGFLKFVYWFGNFHPPSVSLPIGMIIGAVIAEILLMVTGISFFSGVTRFCVWIGGVSAAGTGVLGWLLAGFRITDGAWLLTTHRWLGTGGVVLALLLIVLVEKSERSIDGRRTWLRIVLFTTAVIVMAAGFFGGAMIYGLDHYGWN